MQTLSPTMSSLAHRARLAQLVAPLKRVRPRVPFYKLAAHRVPTLWTLYRGLLRHSPTLDIRFRIRMMFRQNRAITSPRTTKDELRKGHKMLDTFLQAEGGNERLKRLLSRYSAMISAKRAKARLERAVHEQFHEEYLRATRPILTGAYLRPSLYNPPLPRMLRQPHALSIMIYKRRRAHDVRIANESAMKERKLELNREMTFERGLLESLQKGEAFESHFLKYRNEWREHLNAQEEAIARSFDLENARLQTPFPPSVLDSIKAARTRKIAYYTSMRARERAGEHTPLSVERMRRMPPAHVLQQMSQQQRINDRVVRSVSEVGYVGMVKERVGVRTRRRGLWRVYEEGKEENRERLDRMAEEIRRANFERQAKSDTDR
ncbi:hypothetical protein PUNSTDRAFT_98064 [Punctularia strigosozonata HHB-11173 SS5]|uniref:uncharacterized protein n=1 Tax=Punctularia strigosozonata (strain HHB-11173) TaxID=741275 RepID=UPI00044182A1|nr:uncharacterized protein PUNSTDRAFT_98064 [Punctularia strigosozonata HHB-11173 SS5]EIN13030.1 hypothetical protein PUNSTDRAFT_98064 [Punctularia strigosozonata HHB-11173 SS5]